MFKKVTRWIKGVWAKVTVWSNKNLHIAVYFVQALKKAINSGTVDTIADIAKVIIPSGVDDLIIDKVVEFAKRRIPTLCMALEILNAVNVNTGDKDALKASIESLKNTYGDKWDTFMSVLAGEILVMLDDEKIDFAEATILAKHFYDNYVK